VLGEQKQKRVRFAERVLVKKHRVGSLTDLTLSIVVLVLVVLHLFLANHFLVFKVNVEQDLALVFLQQICIGAATFEDLKSAVELALEQVIGLAWLLSARIGGLPVLVILAEENLGCIVTLTFFDEEPVDVKLVVEEGSLAERPTQVFLLALGDESDG